MDGIPTDLKKTKSHNNIADYAKKATEEQKAELVVFELEIETKKIYIEIEKLKEKGIKGYYFSAMIKQKYMSFKIGEPDIAAGFNMWREPFTPLLVKTNITAKI